MATTNSDGSIILSTKVDESGLKKWSKEAGKSTTEVGKSTENATKSTKKYGEQARKSGLTAKNAFNSVGIEIKRVATYLGLAFGVSALVNFSKSAGEMATQQEANVQRLIDIYGTASEKVGAFIDANARALGMSKTAASTYAATYGNLLSMWADQKTNATLTNKLLNQSAVVASKTGRTVEDVMERVRSGMLGNTEAIEDLGINVNIKTIEITKAFKRIANGRSWEQLNAYEQQQVRTLAILEQSTSKYGSEVANTTALTRARYRAAYEDFKATWGRFVNTVLMPILEVATQIFDVFTKGMQEIAKLTGKTVDVTDKQSVSIKNTAKSQKSVTEELKDTAKAQKGALAGFDELNVVTKKTKQTTTTAPSVAGDLGIAEVPQGNADVADEVNESVAKIMSDVGTLAVALGAIFLCFGNIPWGLGLVVAGAGTLGASKAATGGNAVNEVKSTISKIMAIVGASAIAIGLIMVAFGVINGASIGLILKGALALGATVALNWNAIVDAIQGPIGAIMAIVGASLLAIGVILLFAFAAPALGLGLIAAGGVSLGSAVAANWGAITTKVKEICNAIGSIFKNMWNGIIDAAESAWNAILGVFKTGGKVFVAIKDGIISVFKKVINGLIEGINTVIGLPFKGLNKILDKIEGIKILGVKPFGWLDWRAPVPKIPKLAQGSVIPPNKEFMAVLGDNTQEHEIVSPLSTMKQAFLEALTAANISGNNNQPIILQIDGREIARAVRTANGQMGNQTVYGGFANAY